MNIALDVEPQSRAGAILNAVADLAPDLTHSEAIALASRLLQFAEEEIDRQEAELLDVGGFLDCMAGEYEEDKEDYYTAAQRKALAIIAAD